MTSRSTTGVRRRDHFFSFIYLFILSLLLLLLLLSSGIACNQFVTCTFLPYYYYYYYYYLHFHPFEDPNDTFMQLLFPLNLFLLILNQTSSKGYCIGKAGDVVSYFFGVMGFPASQTHTLPFTVISMLDVYL